MNRYKRKDICIKLHIWDPKSQKIVRYSHEFEFVFTVIVITEFDSFSFEEQFFKT